MYLDINEHPHFVHGKQIQKQLWFNCYSSFFLVIFIYTRDGKRKVNSL